jgi:hypothetical protein
MLFSYSVLYRASVSEPLFGQFLHDVGWIKRTGAPSEPRQPTIVEPHGGIGVEALRDTAFTSGRHDVEGFEKLSLRRLGEPACLRAGHEQLIGKPLERLL